ncbi:MAG: hypothetical protein C5B54_10355 [Acidobacteria bacterium]|nr:MAG: hypothetical protein C5B54_10355 [Acidobacteriota bacterium]
MIVLRLLLVTTLVALTAQGQQSSGQQPANQPQSVIPASCPVTTAPEHPFTPPGPVVLSEGAFWWGTEKLWIELRRSGSWEWLPHKPGHEHQVQPLTMKLFWMSVNYDWKKELVPPLKVTGKRLDGTAPPILLLPMSHAISGPNAAMVAGFYVPAPGCWEITGDYKGDKLSFVVWFEPIKDE